jgi:hypothetical protein
MRKQTVINRSFLALSLLFALYFGCSGGKLHNEENPELKIVRFDSDLYRYLVNGEPDDSLAKYAAFLDLLGEKVMGIGKTDSVDFYPRLKAFFSEQTLMSLYRDEQEKFADIQTLERELSQGFGAFTKQFPQIKLPPIYMHVSGLDMNVIVSDDILSLSADKYLGEDYLLYRDFLYDYQRQLMTPDRMATDYLLGFMMANLPFQGNEDVLLDRMLYEGKLRYILSRILPDRQVWEYVGYNKVQYAWCAQNESQIWKTILENQHLFASNHLVTSNYLRESPHTPFLPAESPGRVGIWVGYKIITAYMKRKPRTNLLELMELTDYRALLKQSKYKP